MSGTTAIEWADVPGWPGVRASRCGLVIGPSGKVLKPYVVDAGYMHVLIRNRKLRVHHAVLLAFVGPRPEGTECRHLNDDPGDNRAENLAWGTRLENVADRRRNKGYRCGEDSCSPLSATAVAAIRSDPRSARVVGREHGVSHTTVLKIRRYERWAA